MKKSICLLIIVLHIFGCATYENKSTTLKKPQDYPNYQNASGLKIAAESFAEKKLAEQAFGFDIRSAGLLPVQVVISNTGDQSVEIISGQTFLIDDSNRYWKLLSNNEAVLRVEKNADTAISSSTGTLLNRAIGIYRVVEEQQQEPQASADVRDKGFEGKILMPEHSASGFIFFPGDITSAKELRLQVKFRGEGRIKILNFKLR